MNNPTQAIKNEVDTLIEDARALLNATSNAVDETIVEARKRLALALDEGKEGFDRIREKTAESAKAVNKAAREHLCSTVGIAFGVGAVLGGLIMNRK